MSGSLTYPKYIEKDGLATFLGDLRNRTGKTQHQIAAHLFISRDQVVRYESTDPKRNATPPLGYPASLVSLVIASLPDRDQTIQEEYKRGLLGELNRSLLYHFPGKEPFSDWNDLEQHVVKYIEQNKREKKAATAELSLTANFVDRDQEVKDLLEYLHPGQVVVISGTGGLGKTELAVKTILELEDSEELNKRFPDGFIRHNYRLGPSARQVFETLARHFTTDPSPNNLHRILARKKALLYLDGAENTNELLDVLEIHGECCVFITSRRQEGSMYQTKHLSISPLPYNEADNAAVELLQAWAGTHAPDEKKAHQICELVDGHPLALRLIGWNIANSGMSTDDFLKLLGRKKIETLHDIANYEEESVYLILEWSADQLNKEKEEALTALKVVGLLAPTFFTKEVMAIALGTSTGEAALLLSKLVKYCLVWLDDGRYIVSHDLIYDYTTEYHQPSKEMIIRLTTYYTKLIKEQSELGLEGYKRLEYERPHITAVLVNCVSRNPSGNWKAAQNLVMAMENYLDQQYPWKERTIALKFGLEAARILKHRRNQTTFFNMLRGMYLTLDQKEKAIEHLEQALGIARELGDRHDEDHILFCLGGIYHTLGQTNKAIECFEQILAIAREIGHRENEGYALLGLGNIYDHTPGQTNKAIECFEQALAIAREIGHRENEGYALFVLGDVYLNLGQKDKAFKYFLQALPIIREVGDRFDLGHALLGLGNIYHTLGQTNKAIECFEQALAITREIDDRENEGRALLGLGNVYLALKQGEKAYDYFLQALVITQEVGDRKNEGLTLLGLGGICHSLGQIDIAIECFEEALDILEEIKSPAANRVRSLLKVISPNNLA